MATKFKKLILPNGCRFARILTLSENVCPLLDDALKVNSFFCLNVCCGKPTDSAVKEKAAKTLSALPVDQRKSAVAEIANNNDNAARHIWRAEHTFYCKTCPGPSGSHKDPQDTYFRSCSVCLLFGIKPDGTRQNLKEWWDTGGDCPLGHWPPVDKRENCKTDMAVHQ